MSWSWGPIRDEIRLHRFRDVSPPNVPEPPPLDDVARAIRTGLELWFSRLARQFGARRIRVCLSGGLDSGIIAAFTRKYFADVVAYTYVYAGPGTAPSEDAVSATRLANALGIPLRYVPATGADVIDVLEDALCYGQDWRDFNVHCAVVNELLARAMRKDADADPDGPDSLVLTGDLANELLADYTPVPYDGQEFYALPNVDIARLRLTLVRGLDAGDREVGIFARHGLDLIQPYGLLADDYLRLPAAVLGREDSKQQLSRRIAGDLLPGFVFDRIKVRAQIGNSAQPTGILPVLLEHGYDATWLRLDVLPDLRRSRRNEPERIRPRGAVPRDHRNAKRAQSMATRQHEIAVHHRGVHPPAVPGHRGGPRVFPRRSPVRSWVRRLGRRGRVADVRRVHLRRHTRRRADLQRPVHDHQRDHCHSHAARDVAR